MPILPSLIVLPEVIGPVPHNFYSISNKNVKMRTISLVLQPFFTFLSVLVLGKRKRKEMKIKKEQLDIIQKPKNVVPITCDKRTRMIENHIMQWPQSTAKKF